jgi:UDP-3-O-[3-hydroxymyristoyl] glucosamine N-acyltransferase
VGRGAVIGARAVIGPGCVVGDEARIGAGSRLFANVVIYPRTQLGERVAIHAGAVIGSDGFGNAMEEGRWVKIPQVGRVVVGDDVEIGANTTIDRGTLEDTVIGDGVRLDNLIQIGHNVAIGAHTAIAACVGVAGSTRIGSHCLIGGAAMISGHLTIGDRVVVSGGTSVIKSLAEPGTYTSVYPIEEHSAWLKNAVQIRRLAKLAERVQALESRLAELERRQS